ncbi:MAG: hypothetical protein KAS78_01635 [Candidatus Pacebacteria bacterium]|nr:hypothetical protein [Candidatus Paceibacterota bacterium]
MIIEISWTMVWFVLLLFIAIATFYFSISKSRKVEKVGLSGYDRIILKRDSRLLLVVSLILWFSLLVWIIQIEIIDYVIMAMEPIIAVDNAKITLFRGW